MNNELSRLYYTISREIDTILFDKDAMSSIYQHGSIYWDNAEIYSAFIEMENAMQGVIEYEISLVLPLLEEVLGERFLAFKNNFIEKYPDGDIKDKMVLGWLGRTDLSKVSPKEIAPYLDKSNKLSSRVAKLDEEGFKAIVENFAKMKESEAQKDLKEMTGKKRSLPMSCFQEIYHHRWTALQLAAKSLQHGEFRDPDKKGTDYNQAIKLQQELLLYLGKTGSPDANKLAEIKIDKPRDTHTLDSFLRTYKMNASDGFEGSGIGNQHVENRIFPKTIKLAKRLYLSFIKHNVKLAEAGGQTKDLGEMLITITKSLVRINRQVEQRRTLIDNHLSTELSKHRNFIQNLVEEYHNFHQKNSN